MWLQVDHHVYTQYLLCNITQTETITYVNDVSNSALFQRKKRVNKSNQSILLLSQNTALSKAKDELTNRWYIWACEFLATGDLVTDILVSRAHGRSLSWIWNKLRSQASFRHLRYNYLGHLQCRIYNAQAYVNYKMRVCGFNF